MEVVDIGERSLCGGGRLERFYDIGEMVVLWRWLVKEVLQ